MAGASSDHLSFYTDRLWRLQEDSGLQNENRDIAGVTGEIYNQLAILDQENADRLLLGTRIGILLGLGLNVINIIQNLTLNPIRRKTNGWNDNQIFQPQRTQQIHSFNSMQRYTSRSNKFE